MNTNELRELLYTVNKSYDDFVSLVISFVKLPGNTDKENIIKDFILSHPYADSSDVLKFMIDELGMANISLDRDIAYAIS